jgi:UDP-glucose 4-epimerase
MRVLLTGVGGELGFQTASLLERDPAVEAILGIDDRPPRRRVRSMKSLALEPTERRRILRAVRDFEPTAIVHLFKWEAEAVRTSALAIAVLGAAGDVAGGLDRIVVRSDIAVYGRARGSATVPDESVPPVPTTPWGRSVLEVERLAAAAGRAADVPVASLRFAPLVGRRYPSPLARFLRLPVVAFSALADPAFSVLAVEDGAAAVQAALHRRPDSALNVVGPGAVTVSQAARIGRRVPLPIIGPEWAVLRRIAGVPDHVVELVHRGRTACGAQARTALGLDPARTPDVVRSVYGWAAPPDLQLVEDVA